MSMARKAILALIVSLSWAGSAFAQDQTGRITGRVLDAMSQQPIANVNVVVEGQALGAITDLDGTFVLREVPAGTQQVTVTMIGYAPVTQETTVVSGETATLDFSLQIQAVVMEDIVTTGYGTQERRAITGSVATIDAPQADVGVITNVNQMIDGRVSGVRITQNSGEPGSGQQIRIRGGNSINASSAPLYVIDGIAVSNVQTEADGIGIGGSAGLPRSPLNLLNPSDIETITILKDASATAIYGSRASNGVVLITTKKGTPGDVNMEFNAYVAGASPANSLDVLNGDEYRQFVQTQVAAGVLDPSRLDGLGTANTDWENEVTRSSLTQNYDLVFSGGIQAARFRASLNFMDQEGVLLNNGLQRIQGRLNATFSAFDDILNMDLRLTTSHNENKYVSVQNAGGFEGDVLQNMVVFNPTQPVMVTDPETGEENFYELGPGRQSVRNPVAIAEQLQDEASTSRTLASLNLALNLMPSLTMQLVGGVDRSASNRRTYLPRESAVGAEWEGRALQQERDKTDLTFQGTLTWDQSFGEDHRLDVVGGFETSEYDLKTFSAEARGFATDAFSFSNLSGGNVRPIVESRLEEITLLSGFGRANYSYKDRYIVTGVFRYDGSSNFGAGNKWSSFPAISAAWRISEEEFMADGAFSELRLRGGWGVQGNPAVPPYSSLITLEPESEYVFGESSFVGVNATQNPNPDLKWERTEQISGALDMGFIDNRLVFTLEGYVKNTKDLLLEVNVPLPAVEERRLENIGKVKNTGFEFSFDHVAVDNSSVTWSYGLVFDLNRNEVVDLGVQSFIANGGVSGQGQSGQNAQRILPGHPIGTFWGPEFVGVDAQGRQLFNQYLVERDADGNEISRELIGETTVPTGDDKVVIGDATPSFGLGLNSSLTWGKLDASFLLVSEVGQDVLNNTALVYSTKSNVLQDKNFLKSALDDPIGVLEPAIFSDLWIEDGSYLRLQNLTVGYSFRLGSSTLRAYVASDNLFLITGYSGYDPQVFTGTDTGRETASGAGVGLGRSTPGMDYLSYPRARTILFGVNYNI
jgi:iron complex outermembrane receptor protein